MSVCAEIGTWFPHDAGTQVEKTFRAGEPVSTADIVRRAGQFTYAEGEEYIFMDQESFEETRLVKDEWANFLKEGMVGWGVCRELVITTVESWEHPMDQHSLVLGELAPLGNLCSWPRRPLPPGLPRRDERGMRTLLVYLQRLFLFITKLRCGSV